MPASFSNTNVLVALSDSFEFIGAIEIRLSIYLSKSSGVDPGGGRASGAIAPQ